MNKRCITIILSILIGIGGVYAQQAYALDCAAHSTCSPVHDASPSAADSHSHHRCNCTLWHIETVDHSCRLADLFEPTQQRFIHPAFEHAQLSGLSLAVGSQARVSILYHVGAAHRIDRTAPPLSYPIYLQTLALLC